MNANDLLQGLTFVDEKMINDAERTRAKKPAVKFLLPIAASLAIVITASSVWTNYRHNLPVSPNDIPPPAIGDENNYTLNFNEASGQMEADIYIESHFWEALTQQQAKKTLPKIAEKYSISGLVHYSFANEKVSFHSVDARFNVGEKDVKITIAPNDVAKCYVIDGEPALSEIEGVAIEAGLFVTDKNSRGEQNYIYYADFKIDGVAYYAEYSGEKGDEKFFTSVVADIVLGGKSDLSVFANPIVPELRDDELTEKEAYSEADFGAYLPKISNNFEFNGANRFINQDSNYLTASWSQGYNDAWVTVSKLEDYQIPQLVAPSDTELYDMSRYPIPWSESMPRDKAHIIENPIFKIEDLTLEMLQMREYVRGEQGDPSGKSVNLRFGVLYGDVLVEITTEKIGAEYLLNELQRLQ